MNFLKHFRSMISSGNEVITQRRFYPHVELLEERSVPAIFTVNTIADSGAGSLREAITLANDVNLHKGEDIIRFAIGDALQTIAVQSKLPAITDPIYLDGTAPIEMPNQIIRLLDGKNGLHYGLKIGDAQGNGGGSTVNNLVVGGGFVNGIHIYNADGNTITNNFIGTDETGKNGFANQFGIRIEASSNNTIGGDVALTGNLISGNSQAGIYILSDDADGNIIRRNFIGPDITGTATVPIPLGGIQQTGIQIEDGDDNVIGGDSTLYRNLISGNSSTGIFVRGIINGANGTVIQNNYIGIDGTGEKALPNDSGIDFVESTNGVVFDNLISGNSTAGILFRNSSNANYVSYNKIGVDHTGMSAIPNGTTQQKAPFPGASVWKDGIVILDSSHNVIEGNVLSGNIGNGVAIEGFNGNATKNTVVGNSIGIGFAAGPPIPNNENGIELKNADGNTINGNWIYNNSGHGITMIESFQNDPSDNNIITSNGIRENGGDGISVQNGTGNLISKNSLITNSDLGIDLNNDGVTNNDAQDPDTGPNNLQNFPILTAANLNAKNQVDITGNIDSKAGNSTYPITIEFFSNLFPEGSGHGEGALYLDSHQVNQDGQFNATVPFGFFITATATDTNGNTSEFSPWIFANPLPGFGIIGNWIWGDTNRNSAQDGEEVGLPNVTVELRDTFNIVVATTTSDTYGQYFFTDVTPGDYTLKFLAPTGYGFTTKDAGSDDTLDSDADVFGVTDVFTISAGQTITDLDAGLTLTTIGNFVWHDLDSDGIQEAGEPGLEDVVVSLYEYFGGALVASTPTDASGYYEFTGVAADDYFLVFDPVNLGVGYEFTQMDAGFDDTLDSDADYFGTTMPFIVVAGQLRDDLDAGLIDTSGSGTGSIGDYVWDDTDEDGIQDPEEEGLPGVTVTLEDDQGGWAQATVTDITGYYSFDNLAAGTYTLEFTAPQDYDFTLQHQGGDPTLDSDVDPVTGTIPSITLAAGEVVTDLDAGLVFSPSGSGAYIGDFVWDDVDQDGIQDVGETGLQGIVVRLFDFYTGLEVASTVTDINGHYSFSNVAAGDYYLQFDKPAGMTFTLQDQGGDDTLDSDVDANGITALFSLLDGEIKDDLDAGLYWLP